MPKIRTTRTKKAPEGFDEIEPTLEEFARKMKDGKETHMGYKNTESPVN
jgi:bud site selection protein 31